MSDGTDWSLSSAEAETLERDGIRDIFNAHVDPMFSVQATRILRPAMKGDTPIERAFMFGLALRCYWDDFRLQAYGRGAILEHGCAVIASGHPRLPLCVFPQMKIDDYRVDYMIAWGPKLGDAGLVKKVVVECDGHDFHERTKDQAQRDKKRDRDILFKGAPVLRFTGSELKQKPVECAHNVVRIFTEYRDDFEKKWFADMAAAQRAKNALGAI